MCFCLLFPILSSPEVASRWGLTRLPDNKNAPSRQGGRRPRLHAASVSSSAASQRDSVTSQDVLTMTGCRCLKLAGRESNFKDLFPQARPSVNRLKRIQNRSERTGLSADSKLVQVWVKRSKHKMRCRIYSPIQKSYNMLCFYIFSL